MSVDATPPADDPDRTVVMQGEGASARPAPQRLARGLRLGRYVVLERLGVGGMGEVFAAYDPELDRRVALKVLHARAGGSAGRVRLLREARAIARLSDPHIVPVYDVGEIDGEVFMAMKLIEGRTLDQRVVGLGWRATLGLLAAAARGLSAAHRAGLVHRDMKPTNVLVDERDHVVVMDFGLARASGGPGSSGALEPDVPSTGSGRYPSGPVLDPLQSPITEFGTVVGTLAYMAPEQHEGAAPDARADQFAFCVMAYEMLLGVRPFAGRTAEDLLAAKRRGVLAPPPPGRRIPAALQRAIVRGLAATPEARHADMDALLRELVRSPTRRRRLAVAAAVVLGAVPTIGLLPHASARPCSGAAERLVGVWDAARKDEIAARFAASPSAYASEAWPRVEAELDAYADRWVAAHTTACEATHVTHERSGSELEASMACLDRRLVDLRALIGAFDRVDAATAEHAIAAVRRLASDGACEDVDVLAEAPAPGAAMLEAGARARVADARALVMAGRYADALPVAQAAVETAREAGSDDVLVDALLELASALAHSGRPRESEDADVEAAVLATKIGADDRAAQAAIHLMHNLAQDQGRIDDALVWARHAEGSVARVGRGGHREAELLASFGVLHGLRSDYAASRAAFESALALERGIDEESLEVAHLRNNLAVTLDQLALGDAARTEHLAALEINERLLGPNHPGVAHGFIDLGYTELNLGLPEQAREHFDRALVILAALGDETPLRARAFLGFGVAQSMLGDFASAEVQMREALVRFERHYGANSFWVAQALGDLGYLELSRGRPEIAVQTLRRALEVTANDGMRDEQEDARMLMLLGEALGESGQHEEARREFMRSAAVFEEMLGPDHPMLGHVHANLGHAEVALHRPGHAREHYARALAIAQSAGGGVHAVEAVAMQAEVALCELDLGRLTEALVSSQRALAGADAISRDPEHRDDGAIAFAYFVAAQAELAARHDRQRALGLARAAKERIERGGRELPMSADVAEFIASLEHDRPASRRRR